MSAPYDNQDANPDAIEPYDNEEANPETPAVPSSRPSRQSIAAATAKMSEAEIAEAVKLSADAQEDAKIETAAMLRGEMNEKAKHDLLEMAMHNNDIVTHHQEAPYTEADENVYNDNDEAGGDADGGAPLDADNGDQDEGEDVDGEDEEGDEADEAEEMDIAARNAKLMEMAVHNNEIVQHDLEEEQEVVDARMKLLNAAYANAVRPSAFDLDDLPTPGECGTMTLNMGAHRTDSYTEATSGVANGGNPTSASVHDITAHETHLATKLGEAEVARDEAAQKPAPAPPPPRQNNGCCVVM